MNASIWYFPISALITAITNLVLGFYLILTNYKNKVVCYLAYFCISGAIWSLPYFFWQISENPESAFFWSKILMVGAILLALAYFHFVLVYLDLTKEKFYRIILAVFYIFSFIWLSFDATNYYVAGVAQRSYFKYWPVAGPLFTPFLVCFFFLFAYSSVLLIKKYLKTSGAQRHQVRILLISMSMAFVGGSTNYFLWYGINIAPWGNGLTCLFAALSVYAITKYKFLNVKMVSAEILMGILFIILSFDITLAENNTERWLRIIALFIACLFGFLLVRSLRKEMERREQMTSMAHTMEKANLRLQELDQQKTEFLSIASHQLRTPLSIFKGYIELIQDGAYGKPNKKLLKVMDDLNFNNENIIKLVDEFLNISRIEQGRSKFDFKKIDLNNVIKKAVNELKQKAINKGLKIKWEENQKLKNILADEEKISNILLNFIDNAIKYSEKGEIRIETEEQNNGITVKVKDDGVGFDRSDKVNFFQKFFRGTNVAGINVGGTGLGLYVCLKFIEAHHGRVWAHSKGLGKGSEFGFWIPYQDK